MTSSDANAETGRVRRTATPTEAGDGERRSQGCRWTRALRTALSAFLRARDGGALLVGGMLLLAFLMIPAGAAMSNYAWREAQWEELRAAGRAAVAAAGPLLAGVQQGIIEPVQERVAAFSNALVPGMNVEADDVGVAYDADRDATTITIQGTYDFDDIWVPWDDADNTVTVVVTARLEQERYEVAAALDISGSMGETFRADARSRTSVVKLDALKRAMDAAAQALEDAAEAGDASMLVSVVPFTELVRAADTCNADVRGDCQAARSPGKERYVRMLAGARDTMALTLADARDARDAGTAGHWVDGFHQYGAGTGLGPLRRRFLPDDLLDDRDWNLRRTDVDIDVSAQIPGMGNWTVDDEDFWNGCLMARWGAYWDPAARPAGWRQTDTGNWPATQAVAAWTPASMGLPATTPLHLSDAPPVGTDTHTLFTAYSWPDARVSGDADHLLQGAMQEMLAPNTVMTPYYSTTPQDFEDYETSADNDWSVSIGAGGGINCPANAITPLTEDADDLRTAVGDLAVLTYDETYNFASPLASRGRQAASSTYLHLGIVWGLRTLSPLWRDVWDIDDSRGNERPRAPCAPGEQTAECQRDLLKSIVIISDGSVNFGRSSVSRTGDRSDPNLNADWRTSLCPYGNSRYLAAIGERTQTGFNARFKMPNASADWIDSNDRLNSDGVEAFADAYLRMARDTGNTTRRTTLINTLTDALGTGVAPTPWELFRGRHENTVDALVQAGSGFEMSGRPTLIDDRCRGISLFGSYGRIHDLIYIGDTGQNASTPPVPIDDAAPFSWGEASLRRLRGWTPTSSMNRRLTDWFEEACRLAGQRRVRVNAVYIGENHRTYDINALERCVDLAGGTPGVRDTFVTPNAVELTAAMRQIFTHRRNLRFLD